MNGPTRREGARTAVREAGLFLVSGYVVAAAAVLVVAISVGVVVAMETVAATNVTRLEAEAAWQGRDIVRFRIDQAGVSVARCNSLSDWSDVEGAATVGTIRSDDGLNVVDFAGDLYTIGGITVAAGLFGRAAIAGPQSGDLVAPSSTSIAVEGQTYAMVVAPDSLRLRGYTNVVFLPNDVSPTAQECWCAIGPEVDDGRLGSIATFLADGDSVATWSRQASYPTPAEIATDFRSDGIHRMWPYIGVFAGLFVALHILVRRTEISLYADLGFSFPIRAAIVYLSSAVITAIGVSIGIAGGFGAARIALGPGPLATETARGATATVLAAVLAFVAISTLVGSRTSGLYSRR